jgi:hypothetical protein
LTLGVRYDELVAVMTGDDVEMLQVLVGGSCCLKVVVPSAERRRRGGATDDGEQFTEKHRLARGWPDDVGTGKCGLGPRCVLSPDAVAQAAAWRHGWSRAERFSLFRGR